VTLAALAHRLRAGELSPREAVADSLERIERLNGTINAFISVRAEEALAEADALERTGDRGPLHGVPVAVKDVIDVAGERTTAASRILADNVASTDAAVVARLRAAGAIVVGKLNTHEFAFAATTTSPHFGPARNPWDAERICGGSSGGSGAAAAADLVTGNLGTDTAGSIRIPACLCGVTGLRPSTGRVPNRGVVPVSWSLDTVGPLARSAEDCALLLQAIAGHDPADPSTVTTPVPDYARELARGASGLRIGVVSHLLERAIDPRIADAAEEAVRLLAAGGARVERVDAAFLRDADVVTQLVMLPEAAAAHLEWLQTRLADYGADVRARLLAGLLLPGTAAVTGQRARRRLFDEAHRLFDRFDLLAAPEMPVTAPRIGDDTVDAGGTRLPYRLALIPYNSPWACLGLPAASVPCGFVDGLPVGLALVGRRLAEATVLRAAHAFQQVTDWHERRPPLLVDAVRGPSYTPHSRSRRERE
jgi:aspartyl-tRNA(Asn)/glutamyl-tRNA(Gln) amidotransferase subunit A